MHDQLVVESPADNKLKDRVNHIVALMERSMLIMVPDMLVKVETSVTRLLRGSNKTSCGIGFPRVS